MLAAVDGGGEEALEIRSRIPEPRQWSAEAPHLYDLLLTLKDRDGADRLDGRCARWLREEAGLEGGRLLRADLWVRDGSTGSKLAGAGVLIINPPFTLAQELAEVMPWLCASLAQEAGAHWRLESPDDRGQWVDRSANDGEGSGARG